jgi:cell division protein FtsW
MDNGDELSIDKPLKYFLLVLSVLVVLGVIMVYSASYIYAKDFHGNSAYYFLKQLVFILISVCLAFIMSKTKISFWFKYGWFFHIATIILLVLTFIPGIGSEVKGANRWVDLGLFSIQPGEIVKYTSLLIAIPFFEEFTTIVKRDRIIYGALLAMPLFLLIMQPDFGTFTIYFILLSCACFISSFPRKYFYTSLITGIVILVPVLLASPYRVRRLFSYLDPWKNPQTTGFQIIQSYLAFANGSLWGTGLGNSNEKLFYLPEAHNDFIFSVIGEETGFVGVSLIALLFLLFIYFGFYLALKAKGRKSFILATALIFTLGLQAALNMGVVLGLLPTKGLNLPFISAGGSSLLSNFFAIGLFLSVMTHERKMRMLHEQTSFASYGQASLRVEEESY